MTYDDHGGTSDPGDLGDPLVHGGAVGQTTGGADPGPPGPSDEAVQVLLSRDPSGSVEIAVDLRRDIRLGDDDGGENMKDQ